ncbi:hypothetical protein [Paraburkholderia sediminicola]|uniref:hypothetical protein n=1 Tax=Paraburkholderia sediminicola TaxID=458836 RepID=UPI0038BBA278
MSNSSLLTSSYESTVFATPAYDSLSHSQQSEAQPDAELSDFEKWEQEIQEKASTADTTLDKYDGDLQKQSAAVGSAWGKWQNKVQTSSAYAGFRKTASKFSLSPFDEALLALCLAMTKASGGSAASAGGGSNVTSVGSGNPASIAEKLRGQSAASIKADQAVPMTNNAPNNECCANFVSAVLQKAGELSGSQHTVSVAQLSSELRKDGWHVVSRSQAKPGDVCIEGGDQHTELVASNSHGKITLIGSNNTSAAGHPQVVSYDSYTGNLSNAVYLEK